MKAGNFHLIIKICILGAALHGVFVLLQFYLQKWPASAFDHPVQVTGLIITLPQHRAHAERIWLRTTCGVLELNWYQPIPDLQPGQIWQLWVKIKRSDFQNNPGEFNYASYLKQQGVVASGYVLNHEGNHLVSSHPLWVAPEALRALVYDKVMQATSGLSMQGILIALILGDKSGLNPVQIQVFERTGTSYFMVISGLHIILFAFLGRMGLRYAWSLFPRACLWIPAEQVGLIAGLILGVLYSILAGFVVPTQRALWMIGLMGLARLFLKQYHSLQMLIWALGLVVLWNPFSVMSVAFWLSFLAVFFLIYTLSGREPIQAWWRRYLWEWIYPQWVMYWALIPIVIYCFQSFSVIGFFTNLLAVPIMILGVIPLALLGAVFIFIWPGLGAALFHLSNLLMTWLWQILHYFALQSWWGWVLPKPDFAIMLLAQLGLILIFAPPGWPGRYLGWVMLLPLFDPRPLIPLGQVKITNFNLAHGSAQVYQTQKHVVVVEEVTHLKAGEAAIQYQLQPFLAQQGVQKVDIWVLRFQGNDHGFAKLKQAWLPLQMGKIITAQESSIYDTSKILCPLPQSIIFDKVSFSISKQNEYCELKFKIN